MCEISKRENTPSVVLTFSATKNKMECIWTMRFPNSISLLWMVLTGTELVTMAANVFLVHITLDEADPPHPTPPVTDVATKSITS